MRVIDSHAHVFPYLGGASGFASPEEHLTTMQWAMRQHVQPVRRWRDNMLITEQTLIEGEPEGQSSLTKVRFRVERYGRLAWTADGEDYYRQYMAPSLQEQAASPEYLITLMDYAGVDVAVLQNDSIYGKLNDYFAACVRRWPDRFVALAQVDAGPAPAAVQCAKLRQAIESQGLHGLFFKVDDFFVNDFTIDPFGDAYRPFWDDVVSSNIPVYWQISGTPSPTLANYLLAWQRFAQWLEEYPTVPVVLVGGLSWDILAPGQFPDFIRQSVQKHNILLEVLFPIQKGGEFRYPYAECVEALRFLYGEFGPQKLVWGSDIPNIERYCTYRQSWDYLEACTFITRPDLEHILGDNIARLFQLPSPTP